MENMETFICSWEIEELAHFMAVSVIFLHSLGV